jgi:excisionase family DNA binding protein
MKNKTPKKASAGKPPLTERRWLRVSEVAQLFNCSAWSIYKGVSRGEIPAARVKGIGLRVDLKALTAKLTATNV